MRQLPIEYKIYVKTIIIVRKDSLQCQPDFAYTPCFIVTVVL